MSILKLALIQSILYIVLAIELTTLGCEATALTAKPLILAMTIKVLKLLFTRLKKPTQYPINNFNEELK